MTKMLRFACEQCSYDLCDRCYGGEVQAAVLAGAQADEKVSSQTRQTNDRRHRNDQGGGAVAHGSGLQEQLQDQQRVVGQLQEEVLRLHRLLAIASQPEGPGRRCGRSDARVNGHQSFPESRQTPRGTTRNSEARPMVLKSSSSPRASAKLRTELGHCSPRRTLGGASTPEIDRGGGASDRVRPAMGTEPLTPAPKVAASPSTLKAGSPVPDSPMRDIPQRSDSRPDKVETADLLIPADVEPGDMIQARAFGFEVHVEVPKDACPGQWLRLTYAEGGQVCCELVPAAPAAS